MKNLLLTTVILIVTQLAFSQGKYYTIEQIRDTLTKYENPFWAFHKLDLYKIPIGKFKQDSFLMEKAYDLLDIRYYREYIYQRNLQEYLNDIKKLKWKRDHYLKKYLRNVQKIPEPELNHYIDSIERDRDLVTRYIDTLYNRRREKDSIKLSKSKYQWETSPYVLFHSRLMTQRSYDTIRAYYDRYYKNSTDFNNPVLIALVNMGDPEVRAKYDSIFEAKYATGVFTWDDFLVLTNFRGSYLYKKLAKLILLTDNFVDNISDAEGKEQLSGHIVNYYFPYPDTIPRERRLAFRRKMLGEIMDYFKTDEEGNLYYEFNTSWHELYEYFMEYAAYLEQKEKKKFSQIKYKTSN